MTDETPEPKTDTELAVNAANMFAAFARTHVATAIIRSLTQELAGPATNWMSIAFLAKELGDLAAELEKMSVDHGAQNSWWLSPLAADGSNAVRLDVETFSSMSIGAALCEARSQACEQPRDDGATRVSLDVDVTNERALGLYASLE